MAFLFRVVSLAGRVGYTASGARVIGDFFGGGVGLTTTALSRRTCQWKKSTLLRGSGKMGPRRALCQEDDVPLLATGYRSCDDEGHILQVL